MGFVQLNVANHAIYCLGLFFYAAHDLLAPCRPHGKFVAVKGLVFGTFFQDLGIEAVFYFRPELLAKQTQVLADRFGLTPIKVDGSAALTPRTSRWPPRAP